MSLRQALVALPLLLPVALVAAEPPRNPNALIAAPTPVADELVAPATALRQIVAGGQSLSVRASWFESVLRDADGVAQATISATSYVREGVRNARQRPVIVFFNGGPGASSSPLHFSAFGPRRRLARGASGPPLQDNSDSPIDVADLLFVDPVGTGFSRELRSGGGKAYWSIDGDAASVLSLVRNWLREQHRSKAPLIVVGQSYGGLRASVMAPQMRDLNVVAMVLVSPAVRLSVGANSTRSDESYVVDLPTMAAAAWFHGKAAHGAGDVVAAFEEARHFAESDYAAALRRGSELPAAERSQIAARISALIGLPATLIEAAQLRVDSQVFIDSLLADDGKVLGRLDARVAAPKPAVPLNADRPAAANDPSLGLGKSNVIKSDYATHYFLDELGVKTTRDYYGVTLDVNFNWDWRGSDQVDVVGNLATLLAAKPRARLLVISGYYDLATPMLGVRHAMNAGRLPMERVELLALPGSHSPYDDAEGLRSVAQKIRALAAPAR